MSKNLVEQVVSGVISMVIGTIILAFVQLPDTPGPVIDQQPKTIIVWVTPQFPR